MNSSPIEIVLKDLSEGQVELGNNQPPQAPYEQTDAARKPDGGKDAWLFLAACTIVEALVWGP